MAMRMGVSIGGTTDVSSLADQVKRFKPRILAEGKADDAPFSRQTKDNIAKEPLTSKCIKVIVANFERLPAHEGLRGKSIPAKFLQDISASLSTDLDPKVASLYVFDENYWKRRCTEKLGWQRCQIVEHGLTWKQLFFENHISETLEDFDATRLPFEALFELLRCCQDYVFTVRARQLLSHPNMQAVCAALPNLTVLDLTYGVKSIGMKYERMLFGMKISDASSLAKALPDCHNLTTAILCNNLIDDDLLRMLMTGLVKSSTVTHLDVSHNKITNHGARLLSKLLGDNSVLTRLDISDNQIHAEAGRYLGRALRTNDSLTDLNLRLNRLTDEGGRMLLEGLRDNATLTSLNLSGNSVGRESCTTLCILLKETDRRLAVLDLSCNELQEEDLQSLKTALARNQALTSIDLRMNIVKDALEVLDEIEECVHRNELALRDG